MAHLEGAPLQNSPQLSRTFAALTPPNLLRFPHVSIEFKLQCSHNANPVDIFFQVIVLLFAICVHESAHAWIANRLGDPTAKMLGRVSLNPLVHIDPFGTIMMPLILIVLGFPPFGWAKPTPVDTAQLQESGARRHSYRRRRAGQQFPDRVSVRGGSGYHLRTARIRRSAAYSHARIVRRGAGHAVL